MAIQTYRHFTIDMKSARIQWYKFVDKYDHYHKHGFRSGHNFMVTISISEFEEFVERMKTIAPSLKLYSNQRIGAYQRLYFAVDDDAEAVAFKMGI